MKPRRLIIGGGLKEMGRLLDIMSEKSIMEMKPDSEYVAGKQRVEEVPLREVRGRITSFIGCLDHLGECAACPGCWEYYGDPQYNEDIFDIEEGLDFLDFDAQFEDIELKHRRRASGKLAKEYLGRHGIVGIYAPTDGGIKVFVRGNLEKAQKMLPKAFMGCNLEFIKSGTPAVLEMRKDVIPTCPFGPMEAFDD